MWDNPIDYFIVSDPTDLPPEGNPLLRSVDPQKRIPEEAPNSPLQRLLLESGAEELGKQLSEPFRLSKADLVDLVSRGVTVLSTMAAELGVVLRVQIRGQRILPSVDGEKVRRVVNALVVHLLTVSQAEGWVKIGLEDQSHGNRRGFVIRLTAGSVILPWKTGAEFEEELNTQPELSICRQIVEKLGGALAVQWEDNHQLIYSIWLPA